MRRQRTLARRHPHLKVGSFFPLTNTARCARARILTRRRQSPPPVDATLTRVDYDLRVDPSTSLGAGDSIAGRALLTIDVLREGWVKVPDSRRTEGARCAHRWTAGGA